MSKFDLIKKYLWKRFQKMFLRTVVFTGTYTDNHLAVNKWFEERDVMILRDINENIGKIDYNLKSTKARKSQKRVIWYVPDNPFHRLIGFRPLSDHYRLQGIKMVKLNLK